MFVRVLIGLAVILAVAPAQGAAQSVVDDNPAATSPTPGTLVVAARAGEGTIVVRQLDTGSGDWSPWTAVRGQRTTSGPAITYDDDGTLRLFARGEDGGGLIESSGRVDAWSGWSSPVAAMLVSGPGATNRKGSPTLDVSGIGTDGRVYHAYRPTPTAALGRFGQLPATGTTAPALVSSSASRLNAYVRAADGSVTDLWYPPSEWGSASIGGVALSAAAAVTREEAAVDVFVRGKDNALWMRSVEAGKWTAWRPAVRGAFGTSAPAAAATGGGRIDVVSRDATTLYHAYFTPRDGWSNPVAVGPIVTPFDRGAVNGRGGGDGAQLRFTLVARGKKARAARKRRAGRKRPAGRSSERYRLGQRVSLKGHLRAANGMPIEGASVALLTRDLAAGARQRPLATVTTGPRGQFAYTYKAGPGQRITARYVAYANDAKPADSAAVEARTRARVSLRLSRRGQTVFFSGRLYGGATPRGGKSLFIQAYQRGRWRGLARDTRTDRKGAYRTSYRFDTQVLGNSRIRFRAVVRRDNSYPFLGATSKAVTLRR